MGKCSGSWYHLLQSYLHYAGVRVVRAFIWTCIACLLKRRKKGALSVIAAGLSINLSIYLSIYLSVHPSVRPSVRPPVQPSIHPSACLSIYLSIYLYRYLSIYLYIYRLNICLSVHLSILNSLRWPIYVINWVDNSKLSCYTLPPRQHYSLFRNLLPLFICLSVYLYHIDKAT